MKDTRTSLRSYLDTKGILYRVKDKVLHVDENLTISSPTMTRLPTHLVVHGSMHVYNTPLDKLPDTLVVEGFLEVINVPISCLPTHLSVGAIIGLRHTKINSLPPGFQASRSLRLVCESFTCLPEGLDVGENLYIEDTGIRRFPQDMRVGGMITPPKTLIDLHTFMHGRPDKVVVPFPASAHQIMDLRAAWSDLPDLWRVMLSRRDMGQLVILRDKDGSYVVKAY